MNVEAVRHWHFAPLEVELTPERAMLYALSIGMARDPMDREELRFAYEPALKVMPSWAAALGIKGFWAQDPASGIDWVRLVLAEQSVTFHRIFPAEGLLLATSRIDEVVDKGAGIGALIFMETELRDTSSGDLIVTLNRTLMARADGGFGGPPGRKRATFSLPHRAPDLVCDLATSPGQALIYRLNGDYNPLHADPDIAMAAGFPRPIFHGLGTLGVACHALLKSVCHYDPERMRSIGARFSAPVFPGDTIRTEMWRDADMIHFQSRVPARDAIVLRAGHCRLSA